MSTTPDDRDTGRRTHARADDAERAYPFARRIDCDGSRDPMLATPARGGGMREPEAWERRRDPRR